MWMQDCDQCASAKLGGLQVWMQHLTDEHAVPTEWPSDRAARLTGVNALRPYTTIAESKKKRRKDSIPRPLNSFMLFAQHIRRNVLRVFSDASNSVISQQLGDLWRTVPRSCRNQYDDEANRLVKIHQIEFPNYKYQPKKRQITSTIAANTSDHTRTNTHHHINNNNGNSTPSGAQSTMSVSVRDDQMPTAKLISTSLIKSNADYSVYSGPMSNKLPSVNRYCSSSGIQTINSVVRRQASGVMDVNTSQRTGGVDLVNSFVTSPPKQACNTIYAKLEPKPLSVNTVSSVSGATISNNNTSSFRPSPHSLSSVLPPLLTLSHHATVLNDQFPNGICDSAYASGINSSSSSSASSPAVGELISPAKSCSSASSSSMNVSKQSKTSPIRRKIHFIPIRPQSQQLPPVGNQPTRQRFLSANNGTNMSSVGGCLSAQIGGFQFKSHPDNVIISQMSNDQINQSQQQHQHQKEEINETILLQDGEMLTTDILTPVYIQLDHDGRGPTEGLMFTLPPGTAIIQTNGDIGRSSFQGNSLHPTASATTRRRIYIANGNRIIPAVSKSVQVLQPLKVMNVIHHQQQHSSCRDPVLYSPVVTSEMLSSSSYSCNSSPNSVVSPMSADVFLPMQQIEVVSSSNFQRRQSSCLNVYHFDAQNELDMCIDEEQLADEEKMTHFSSQQLDTMTNIISIDECMEASSVMPDWSPNLTSSESIAASSLSPSSSSSSSPSRTTSIMTTVATSTTDDDHLLSSTFNTNRLPPLTVDVMKSVNESLISSSTSNHTTGITTDVDIISDTEFPITADDNFDSSFDAMMNSIDITTFLPGTFQSSEEQHINGDYDNELNRQLQSTSSYDLECFNMNKSHMMDSNSQHMKIDEFDDSCHIVNSENDAHTSTSYNARSDIDFTNNSNNHDSYVTINSNTVMHNISSSSLKDNPYSSIRPVGSSSSSLSMPQTSSLSTATSTSLRMNSLQELLSTTPQVYSSTLADLDSLDKSSLFIIKPEWSVLA
ncbi:unnamed protein product [Heterobilharzia americana]|nr:unnamed protein product [Heterobilharzia americana]